MYITTEDDLFALRERLEQCETLALDTEFVREKTYFHKLGLIQVAGDGVCAIIDPLSIPNLNPILELIKRPNVLKVFHAARQDLEILYRLCGNVIQPIFDTQVAAALVGWGLQISFAKIVQRATGKKIHKAETYTDWCRRPLSQSQIDYALDDVRYLIPVYQKMLKLLKKYNRMDWVEGEFQFLQNPENYREVDPWRQFLRIKNIRSLNPRNLAVLRELAAWREEEAMKRDCLAKSIVRDEPLLEIARNLPRDPSGLGAIRGFHRKEVSRSGRQILEAISRGLAVPKDGYPVLREPEGYSAGRGVEELLAAYVQIRSEELKIEPSILADRKQIRDFVKCYETGQNMEDHFLFQGWRRECVGVTLYALLDGRRGLAINNTGRVNLIEPKID